MRTFIFAVAAIVAASWAIDQAPAADRIPAFDIVRNCNAEVANVGTEKVADCTKDETDAKNELNQSWSQFGASDKQTCDPSADNRYVGQGTGSASTQEALEADGGAEQASAKGMAKHFRST